MYLVKHPTATLSLLGAPRPRQPEAVLDRFNRADLAADHQRKIDQLADQIVASWKSNRPALGVETVGHADKRTDIDPNADFGRQRAERVLKAVSDAVWKRDVDVQQRMNWGRTSQGVKHPVSMNPALNRRVEIFIQWGRVVRPACGYDIRNAFAIERESARRTLALSSQVAGRFIQTVGAVGSRGRFIPTVIDNKHWFAKLYEFTTFYEIGKVSSFRHPAFVLHFIPIFYDLYYRALENWTAGHRTLVSNLWQVHFTRASRPDNSSTLAWISGVQDSIVTGTTAHVQGDMATALERAYRLYVAKYCLSPPPRFDEFRSDFFKMDTMVFKYSRAAFVLHVSHFGPGFAIGSKPGGIELGQFLFGVGARMPGSLDIGLVDQWRDTAWSEARRRLGQ
jgi:Family of unknown function (DUF5995)